MRLGEDWSPKRKRNTIIRSREGIFGQTKTSATIHPPRESHSLVGGPVQTNPVIRTCSGKEKRVLRPVQKTGMGLWESSVEEEILEAKTKAGRGRCCNIELGLQMITIHSRKSDRDRQDIL